MLQELKAWKERIIKRNVVLLSLCQTEKERKKVLSLIKKSKKKCILYKIEGVERKRMIKQFKKAKEELLRELDKKNRD